MTTRPPLRLILVDDHEVVRRGMAAILEGHAGLEIVGEAPDGRRAVALALETKPDVVVMDVGMKELNGFEATRRIMKLLPKTEVLILTMHDGEQLVREVIEAGARGYVLKSDAGRELLEAVRSLARHQPYFTSAMAARVYEESRSAPRRGRPRATGITQREREVVQLIVEGRSNREVAETLGITPSTASTHRARAMKKTGTKSLAELVLYAVREGIVPAAK
jgi:DNA-binding NarL/FixJ family response regulator